ncbi:MAG: hypothetical protein LBP95_14235 [Deltaproteobacteria bacterium]|nr:hypothetical protein [Deltaproteobacteria bacterium]
MASDSRLDYLMKALDISGKTLSGELKIDETTVSKWRKNQRRLTFKNRHAARMAEYFLDSEMEGKRQVAAGILKGYKADLNFESRRQKIEALALWLTEETGGPPTPGAGGSDSGAAGDGFAPASGYNTCVHVFTGEAGVDEALDYFMRQALAAPPGRTLYVVDYNGIDWAPAEEGDGQRRVNGSVELFKTFIEKGQKFVIIDCNTDLYKPYTAIFRWLRLYLTGGVEVLTHPALSQDKNYFITFVLRDEIALHCVHDADYPDRRHCLIFKNKETVNHHARAAESILKSSKKLVETVENESLAELFEVMERQLRPGRPVCAMNPPLSLLAAGPETLEEILSAAGASREETVVCLNVREMFEKSLCSCEHAVLVDLDALDRAFTADEVVDRALSALCRREVRVTQDQTRRILEKIIERKSGPESSANFVSFSDLGITPNNLSIMAQDDAFLSVWDLEKYQKSMYSANVDVVSGFYRFLRLTWESIPGICKETDWRNKQLKRYIETD